MSRVPSNIIYTMMLQNMSLRDRFTCALTCKAWSQEAAAATRSIILRHRVQDLSCFETWLAKHGGQLEVLQLHQCRFRAVLTALPCPQLQNLLLEGSLDLDSRVWSDIAAATKLTSVCLEEVSTDSEESDVVSALTALPELEQLTLSRISIGQQWGLSDSMPLQELTKLTALKLGLVRAAAVLENMGSLTRLQDLTLDVADDWAAAGCPGLQELKALTRLDLIQTHIDIAAVVSQLTALQQLVVPSATPTALNKLSALTGLTCLYVRHLEGLTPPLQLPGLRHLQLSGQSRTMPMSFLGSCTQLLALELGVFNLSPGSLMVSTMLQHLDLYGCKVASAADEAAGPVSWQQVFPGPGRLPHLTSLQWSSAKPAPQHADMECVVACRSSLQVLDLDNLRGSISSALTRLSGLTSLKLMHAEDQECSSLAQLTALRELKVGNAGRVFAAGLRPLAALEQLTSLGLNSLGWSSDVLREQMSDRLPGPLMYEVSSIRRLLAILLTSLFGCGGPATWQLLLTPEAAPVMLRPQQVIEATTGGAGLYDHEAAAAAPCVSRVLLSNSSRSNTPTAECCHRPAWQEQHEDTERVASGQANDCIRSW